MNFLELALTGIDVHIVQEKSLYSSEYIVFQFRKGELFVKQILHQCEIADFKSVNEAAFFEDRICRVVIDYFNQIDKKEPRFFIGQHVYCPETGMRGRVLRFYSHPEKEIQMVVQTPDEREFIALVSEWKPYQSGTLADVGIIMDEFATHKPSD